MKAHTKETQATMTPQKSLQFLKEGNQRFQQNLKANRDLLEQVSGTSHGQYPFAVILSCIDSRVPAELVFDQGIGDVFSARVAGNIINEDMLGSMEYACKVAGSKIVVVMGHSKCGAVTAACKHVELGNITTLLDKIQPAVSAVDEEMSDAKVEKVAAVNVKLSIERVRNESSILAELEAAGEIEIVGAMYDVTTGAVSFYE
jgi:carbonic anhydrase